MGNTQLHFTVYANPVPQGSMRGFVMPGKNGAKPQAILTSDNKNLKPYRGEVTREAMIAVRNAGAEQPFAGKHEPVSVVIDFYMEKPPSVGKKRHYHVVKPDLSKLLRSTEDAMTGIVMHDDAQIMEASIRKHYGSPARVEISVTVMPEPSTLTFNSKL